MTSVSEPPAGWPCLGVSYLSNDLTEDGVREMVMECNGGWEGDCGWRVVILDEPHMRPEGEWDVFVSSDTFLPLHEQHLDHRAEEAARRG